MGFGRRKRQILFAGTGAVIITLFTFPARFAPITHLTSSSEEIVTESIPNIFGSATSKTSACYASPPKPAIVPDSQGRFDWRSVPAQHPVDLYTELPYGQPLSLPRVQAAFTKISVGTVEKNLSRRIAVKEAFQRGWLWYRNLAWMKDELAPISGNSKNTFGGWGATLVDSLDSLWILDMKEEFAEAVEAAVSIDFGPRGTHDVNMLETIIRYLGGFIAAYDVSGCKDARLLQKAMEVGDMAYASFDTPNRMPITRWNPKKAFEGQEQSPAEWGIIAEMASASVEFTRLSQLTGDMRYFDAITRVTKVLDEQQGRTQLPGMWPIDVNVRAPILTSGSLFGLGAMSGSAYEYLPKMYQLLSGVGEAAAQYRRMYEYAMETVIGRSLLRPMVEDKADILITSNVSGGGKRDSSGQHLVCFAGGMLGLGGRLTENNSHVDVEPGSSPFSNIHDPRYMLRPEAIESVFYMYRITEDAVYQDKAWEMFQAIENNTATDYGNAAIRDVTKYPEEVELEDSMESFLTAETLKYFYLIFSEPDAMSLDEWMFNTEAHPFRIPRS